MALGKFLPSYRTFGNTDIIVPQSIYLFLFLLHLFLRTGHVEQWFDLNIEENEFDL